ncbi:hypothetical protein [Pseudonocardia xishanensis]|uniref:hypothetical protein n=1 Tax=Pseudonocardia xishanensis TaxID=630995 RepID=UPI0031E5CBD5
MTPRHVPARVVTAPHRTLLARGPSARQFGLDPAGSVAVEALPEPVLPLLEGLREPTVSVEWVGRATTAGVGPDYAAALLAGLVARGVLVDAEVGPRQAARRAAARVEVRGEGPLAAATALGLARGGIGAVHVVSRGPVERGELGGGLDPAQLGRARGAAAAAAIGGLGLGTDTGPGPPGSWPDLVVLADALVPDPGAVAALQAAGVDHLVVSVREGVGVVGPLVLVGRSACLGCVELGRARWDPAWPALSAQLAGRRGSAEPETVAATAALGAAQALVQLDGAARPPTLGAALELDPHAGRLTRRVWEADPRCSCGWAGRLRRASLPRTASAETCAAPGGRETIMG